MTDPQQCRIYVLAGVNGAGKSSIAGAMFEAAGAAYYNPDEAARALIAGNRRLTQTEANSVAWRNGVRLLNRAIEERLDFAFETTLGGNTIPRLLAHAASEGIAILVWYVGLANAELHITRVEERVRRGGHNIEEADIRRRYEHSRLNLIYLLPLIEGLRIFDNSFDADPNQGKTPKPKLLLHIEKQRILGPSDLTGTPKWAKPIIAAAIRLDRRSR
jgi:predicted ABC-type ATPase